MSEDKIRKIKAILTQAESTTFEEERNAFNSKAAELMAKWAIDEAMLRDHEVAVTDIIAKSYVVGAPYSIDRLILVNMVASAMGCFSYYTKQSRDGWKTATKSKDHNTYAHIVGFPEDVEMVEIMLESLNRQMEEEREREMRHQWFEGMGQKKVWNASFIRGYAQKIGWRLVDAYREIAGEQTGSVALALRSKKERLQDKMEAMGLKSTKSNRQTDLTGYRSGQSAAERATIHKSIKS